MRSWARIPGMRAIVTGDRNWDARKLTRNRRTRPRGQCCQGC